MLGGEHPLWSWELPPWRCPGSAILAVSRPAGFLPVFFRGLRPVPEPTQPSGPSEHGHPAPCLCPGLSPRPPPWLELCRASVGATGLETRAGLGAGGATRCPAPVIAEAETQGTNSPWTSVPIAVAQPQGRGRGGGWGGRDAQPLPSSLTPGLPTVGRGPGAPTRSCPGSAARMQSVTAVPLITEHRCREGSGTKGPLCPSNGAVHSSAGALRGDGS